MRTRLFVLGVVLCSPVFAGTYTSEPRQLDFEDDYDVFAAAEYDTGSLPSGSPLAVRFYIESWGGAYTEFEATSQVSWPETLEHTITGVPGSGVFGLECDIDLAAVVDLDLWGYKGSWDVWSTTLYLKDEVDFDPSLLGGKSVSVSADGDIFEPFEVPLQLFTGVSLNFIVDVFPRASATLSGLRYETNDDSVITREDGIGTLEVPYEPGLIEMETIFVANLEADLQVILEPAMEVCVAILGCYEVAAFEIPVDLVEYDGERRFDDVDYEHPLPSLEIPISSHDFGEVEVGSLANMELPFKSIGVMDVEGWVRVEGSDDLSVYPEYFFASPGNTDGVVITFAPQAEGLLSASLIVESSDPLKSEVVIPLAGTGFVEAVIDDGGDDDGGDGDGDGESVRISGCGCSAAPGMGLTPLFGVLGLIGLRRRRG